MYRRVLKILMKKCVWNTTSHNSCCTEPSAERTLSIWEFNLFYVGINSWYKKVSRRINPPYIKTLGEILKKTISLPKIGSFLKLFGFAVLMGLSLEAKKKEQETK